MAESRGVGILRSNDTSLLFYASLFDGNNTKITGGSTDLRLWHLVPTSGAIETYDFNDNTFKTGAVADPIASMTYYMAQNNTYDTSIWTYRHISLVSFSVGDKYIAEISHDSLEKPIYLHFQYGDLEGDEATLIPDFVWDELLSGHVAAGSAGLALGALGLAISARGNNATLNALLGVQDTAGRTLAGQVWEETAASHNNAGTMGALLNAAGAGAASPGAIADAVWDELLAGHVNPGSAGLALGALIALLEAGGVGDAEAILDQVRKIDLDPVSVGFVPGSLADMVSGASANREFIIAVNVNGTTLRIEMARELLGIVDVVPTTASAEIFDDVGGLVFSIGSGSFGAMNARGFFGYNWTNHALQAGRIYQFRLTIGGQTTTKAVKILAPT